jgi:hypothetical protein
VFLLYQVAEIAQQAIYLKMLGLSQETEEIKKQVIYFAQMIKAVEATHQIKILADKKAGFASGQHSIFGDFGFVLPHQVFKLRVPSLVDISVSGSLLHADSVLGQSYSQQTIKVKRDRNLVLNIRLSPVRRSDSEAGSGSLDRVNRSSAKHLIKFETSVLQYHGHVFKLDEGAMVQHSIKQLKPEPSVSGTDESLEEVLILNLPTVGNYLLRMSCIMKENKT